MEMRAELARYELSLTHCWISGIYLLMMALLGLSLSIHRTSNGPGQEAGLQQNTGSYQTTGEQM